jgi:hypothetical protein
MSCPCYHFDYFPKGYQVRYERDNTTTKQFTPFSQILTVRHEYLYNDKLYVVTVILKDSLKFSYHFKGKDESERLYDTIIQNQ